MNMPCQCPVCYKIFGLLKGVSPRYSNEVYCRKCGEAKREVQDKMEEVDDAKTDYDNAGKGDRRYFKNLLKEAEARLKIAREAWDNRIGKHSKKMM